MTTKLTLSTVLLISSLLASYIHIANCQYKPTWESLDSRPLPQWYDDAKFGIFLHWGVFSVPSFGSEWFWWSWEGAKQIPYERFMNENYRPGFTYADFASQFTAEFYDPAQWADIFEASGARYVVLTSKHHEGFTNWPSSVSFNWNSMDVGPKLDLVGTLASAVRTKPNLRFGLYHSLYEWFNPLYITDKKNKYKTQLFVQQKTMPELYELVMRYKPEVIWSDGDWEAPDFYWNSTNFLAWLFNESPVKDTVVTNDRWGSGCACHHGSFYTCSDRYEPGKLVNHKWENCMTVDKSSWGYVRQTQLDDIETIEYLVHLLVETVSCGGNLLMNVGPTHDGRIIPIFEERLKQMGSWLKVNGEAIYGTKPWIFQNDTVTPGIWYTSGATKGAALYATALQWPKNTLVLGAVTSTKNTTVTMLGYPGSLKWGVGIFGGIWIQIPTIHISDMPCNWAWVFKIENVLQ